MMLESFFSYLKKFSNDHDVLDINQFLCLSKAVLRTKNGPKRLTRGRLGSFFVFNSAHLKKSDGGPEHSIIQILFLFAEGGEI